MTQTETPATLPFGAWPSPVTIDLLTTTAPSVREPGSDGETLLWAESRPQERGRQVLVKLTADGPRDLTPAPWSVRSRVHEYGGGAWAAIPGVVVFSHVVDDRLYRLDGDGEPQPITPEGGFRYADLQIDAASGRVYAVREDHSGGGHEPVNALVVLDLDGPNENGGAVIASGTDFVSSPRMSPDGTRLAWITWNHPNMPWDETTLWIGSIAADGTLANPTAVVRGERESVILPGWDRENRLVYVSDRTGWWHLYRREGDRDVQITDGEREFGVPLWVFGVSTWVALDDGSIVAAWTRDGGWNLSVIDPETREIRDLDLPFTSISAVKAHPDGVSVIVTAGTAHQPSDLLVVDTRTGQYASVRPQTGPTVPDEVVSVAEAVSWTAPDGNTAHGFYYPPHNPDATGPAGELPPLIVEIHGGPTSAASSTLDPATQFWTSRGFAILDVNYGGSTGYGRAYRERLNGTWGVVDVDDCVSGALALADQGRVDRDRLVIRGGSAGGYTTLAALTFHDVFRAGVSYYGIGDLEALATDTHKFEARYGDGLVAPYPEGIETYRKRSPIHHVDRLSSALLLLQGMDDKVVPPNQAFTMADAVRRKGLPVALLTFEGEGHGFRMAETTKAALEAELSFFAQIFGYEPSGEVPVLAIDNLPSPS
jgi:dipeptidyl aminopeptidase/acylaminoacyl peptidase